MRLDTAEVVNILGFPMSQESIAVSPGWNLIGSVMSPFPVGGIVTSPPGIVTSFYFGYSGKYVLTDSILPGLGYWVKASQSGTLIVGSTGPAAFVKEAPGSELGGFDRLTISDALGRSQTVYFGGHTSGVKLEKYELPPPSPSGEFDVRFASNRMLECTEGLNTERFPLAISGAAYPLKISWSRIAAPLRASLRIGRNEVPMEGTSSLEVVDIDAPIAVKVAGRGGIPREFALEQNFPNPFNPSTEIRYALNQEAIVTLRIFNVLGQLVTKLVADAVQEEGYHSLKWSATDAPSGVYYYRLDAVPTGGPLSAFTQMRKMLLVK